MLRQLSAAAVRRDFALARSYRVPFVVDLATTLFTLTMVFGIGRLIGQARGHSIPTSGGYLAFAVIGLVALRMAQATLFGQGYRLRNEQTTGTLEVLLAGPAKAWQVVLAGSSYDLVEAIVSSAIMVVLAVAVFGVSVPVDALSAAVAVAAFIASVGFVAGVGMALSAFVLVFKQVTGVLGFAVAGLSVLCGVYFPLSVLPGPLQALGRAIPFTWGLEVLRAALLQQQIRTTLLGALVAVDVVVIVLGARLVDAAVSRARRTGKLGHY